MKPSTQHLREDVEDQFELPDMPPRMTAKRAQDFKKPCALCQAAECPCIGWEAFDTAN